MGRRSDDFDDIDDELEDLWRRLAEVRRLDNGEGLDDIDVSDDAELAALQREVRETAWLGSKLDQQKHMLEDLKDKLLELKQWEEIAKMSPDKNTPELAAAQAAYDQAKAVYEKEYGENDTPDPRVAAQERRNAALREIVNDGDPGPSARPGHGSVVSFTHGHQPRHEDTQDDSSKNDGNKNNKPRS
jgi:hypothetical protein